MNTQLMTGYVTWLEGASPGERVEVQRAVFRDDQELAIDCNCAFPGDAPDIYTILLRRQDALLFRGEWSTGKGQNQESGQCSCRLYSNGGRVAFIGVWEEEGSMKWFGELSPANEKSG